MKNIDDAAAYLLSGARWAVENDQFLDEFVRSSHRDLPKLALITKGQYLSIGAPNVASPGLKPYVYVHSVRTVRKLIGRVLRIKEGKRKQITDHLVAIPENYDGYFEILSEDGHPVKCLESVLELCQKFPEMCLVRAPCKAYLPDADGELRNQYHSRTVQEGEVLTLVGQFNFKRVIFLRCFDEMGASVYLKLTQKGRFSPIARADAITGVHCVANLLNKRLPLTVRQIVTANQGSTSELGRLFGGGSNQTQGMVLQLTSVIEEQSVLFYSLQKHLAADQQSRMFVVPVKTHIRLTPALNQAQIKRTAAFNELSERCESCYEELSSKITSINEHQLSIIKSPPLNQSSTTKQQQQQPPPVGPPPNNRPNTYENYDPPHSHFERPTDNYDDDEIDQLYDYVRGLAPIPDSLDADRQRQSRRRAAVMQYRKHRQSTSTERHQRRLAAADTAEWRGPTIVEIHDDPVSTSPDIDDTTSPSSTSKSPPHYEKAKRHSKSVDKSSLSNHSSSHRSPPLMPQSHRYISKSTEKLFHPAFLSPPPPGAPPPPLHPPPRIGGAGGAQHLFEMRAGAGRPGGHGGQRRRPFSMVVPDHVNVMPPPMHPPPPHLMHHLFAGAPTPSAAAGPAGAGMFAGRMYASTANLSTVSHNHMQHSYDRASYNSNNNNNNNEPSEQHQQRPISPRNLENNNNYGNKLNFSYNPAAAPGAPPPFGYPSPNRPSMFPRYPPFFRPFNRV